MIRRALATYTSATADADELIQRYAPIIDRAARRIALRTGLKSAFDDLWSAGALGLLEAAPRYDATRGVSFETFVEHRIRGAMLDELRRMDHLPRRLRSRTDDVQKVKQRLAGQLGRDATTEEVAQAMNIDMEELSGLETLLEPHVPLDKAAHVLASGGEDGTSNAAEDHIARAQMAKALSESFKKLPERLQTVMGLHYVEGLTYREIAKMLDVSEPRVCQLHADALKRLRATMPDFALGSAGG
ncbi:MAG TPA: FliA/WhiG family RNA polymerase sigma factor [Polyangia bacterium]|jgi:RNA polymerase sigma factor for flagellar operon FliA|nr:FliA/WhiG family RNA polymerase sigma factor [Polyangia bacterium]